MVVGSSPTQGSQFFFEKMTVSGELCCVALPFCCLLLLLPCLSQHLLYMYIYIVTFMYCPDLRLSSFSSAASYSWVTRATIGFACDVEEVSEVTEGEGGTAETDWLSIGA